MTSIDLTSTPRSSRTTWILRLVAVALIVSAIALDAGLLFGVPILFVLIVPFEKMFPRHRGQKIRRPGVGTDIGYALATPILQIVGIVTAAGVGLLSLAWLPGVLLSPLVHRLPPIAAALLAVALFDLAVYWAHRWAHEVPALWRFHAVHHSPEQMDWISGFRSHPVDGLVIGPAAVFLLAAGFEPELTGLLAIVNLVIGLFLHANVRWRWRPLHRVVATPEFHHWHHANEADAHCSNYSGFLPIWDVVFGTFYMPANKRPLRYGIDEPIGEGMVDQLVAPVRPAGNPLRAVAHPLASARRCIDGVRSVLHGVASSTTRPRRRRPARGELCNWALRSPVALAPPPAALAPPPVALAPPPAPTRTGP
jgi:sterol desaturase/sphingolipid hydroxylase (fatty acid hydroxylase superfamily)